MYEILLLINNTQFLKSYNSDIAPVITDVIMITEDRFFKPELRILGSEKNKIALSGKIYPIEKILDFVS